MSDASEDAELSRLQRAAEFMRNVRETQAMGVRKMNGPHRLSQEQQAAIAEAASNSALVGAIKKSVQMDLLIENLSARFEEMARRQGTPVDAGLRPSVVKLLAGELWVNRKALGVPADRLVSATLHQGAIAPELQREFEHPLSVIAMAMERVPTAPRQFLQDMKKQIESMQANPEFEGLHRMPGVFRYAAIHYHSNPEAFLRKIEKQGARNWQGRLDGSGERQRG